MFGNKIIKKAVPMFLVFALAFAICAPMALAQTPPPSITSELQKTGGQFTATGQETDLPVIIGKIIKVILAFMGIVLLVVVLYGGFLWMTAGGSDEKVDKAKSWIINGIIGLVIVLLSYAIAAYVVDKLTTTVLGSPSSTIPAK